MKEIWKDIQGYEGLYQVSNLGRVRGIKRNSILKPWTVRGGYLSVNLCKNNLVKKRVVHRLVAEAFIDNPENKPEINHISGNKLDNSISNLEWCTREENIQHSWDEGLRENVRESLKTKGPRKKNVICITTGIIYNSISEAERQTGVKAPRISACCRGQQHTAGGYEWEYFN